MRFRALVLMQGAILPRIANAPDLQSSAFLGSGCYRFRKKCQHVNLGLLGHFRFALYVKEPFYG